MNNTIEVFEEMKKDTVIWNRTTRTKALTKAIATLKAVESASDELPEIKWLCDNCNCLVPQEQDQVKGEQHECKATGHILKHLNEHPHINPTQDCPKVQAYALCQIPYTKQILKVKELEVYKKAGEEVIKELETEAKLGNIPYKEAIALKDKIEELEAKIKDI